MMPARRNRTWTPPINLASVFILAILLSAWDSQLSALPFLQDTKVNHNSRSSIPPLVIAHRGASGYLPEHTLPAKTLAYGMGADYLEQDVVLTKDNIPVVLHDIHLDTVTDVKHRFPNRQRPDGRFYAIDFTLAELKTLAVHERSHAKDDSQVFPNRYAESQPVFRIPTLAEELSLIRGLNRTTSRTIGVYVEIKQPNWHHSQGKDISRIVLDCLNQHGYHDREDLAFVQCFEVKETERLRRELNCQLKLIQLIGESRWDGNDPPEQSLRDPSQLRRIAEFADGIGPSLDHLFRVDRPGQPPATSSLVQDAHAAGLLVHPYTARADQLPPYVSSFQQLVSLVFHQSQCDGLFTDHPDQAIQARDNK